MKKFIIILIFFLMLLLFIPKNADSKMVMSEEYNVSNHYELIFYKENLNIGNFKLKLGIFTSYEYNINKVYIKYNDKIKEYFIDKEYFSFDSSNFNKGIEKLKDEYNLILKENYLYDELDKDINSINIEKVDIYVGKDALVKFKRKYPNVIIRQIK